MKREETVHTAKRHRGSQFESSQRPEHTAGGGGVIGFGLSYPPLSSCSAFHAFECAQTLSFESHHISIRRIGAADYRSQSLSVVHHIMSSGSSDINPEHERNSTHRPSMSAMTLDKIVVESRTHDGESGSTSAGGVGSVNGALMSQHSQSGQVSSHSTLATISPTSALSLTPQSSSQRLPSTTSAKAEQTTDKANAAAPNVPPPTTGTKRRTSDTADSRPQRAPQACERCRRKKLRCIGGCPCTRCKRASHTCDLAHATSTRTNRPRALILVSAWRSWKRPLRISCRD
jgi:hypothetical protein